MRAGPQSFFFGGSFDLGTLITMEGRKHWAFAVTTLQMEYSSERSRGVAGENSGEIMASMWVKSQTRARSAPQPKTEALSQCRSSA